MQAPRTRRRRVRQRLLCEPVVRAVARLVHVGPLAVAHKGLRQRSRVCSRHSDLCAWLYAPRGYRTILSGKMHFCGPDQLHGFEQRLTTDIYPADFNWTPDWDRPEHRPSWYHNMSSVRDAGLCVRSNQLDFDDETAFMAERAIFDIARDRGIRGLSCWSPRSRIRTTRSPFLSATGTSTATRTSTCRRPRQSRSIRIRAVCATSARWIPSR